jgi:hypothetical protein
MVQGIILLADPPQPGAWLFIYNKERQSRFK